jgi:anti-sigma28 factor (negative regulator of flagellin synthesis)
MKIDPNSLPASQTGIHSTPQDRASQRSAESQRIEKLYGDRTERAARSHDSVDTDRVQLSSLSHHISAQAVDSPERASRIERLSQLVQSGRYHVDSRAVSRALVDELISTSPTQGAQ